MKLDVLRGMGWLLGLMLLSGCASYPLGMSEQEWQALTPQQQLDAREKQSELDQKAAERRAAEARLEAEREAQQQAELAQRKANAAYGERVQCVLQNAEYKEGKSWYALEPVGFDLVVGEIQPLSLVHIKNKRTQYTRTAYAGFNGQTVSICRYQSANSHSADCVRMVGTTLDYQRGLTRTLASRDYVRGTLRCGLKTAYPLLPMRPYR